MRTWRVTRHIRRLLGSLLLGTAVPLVLAAQLPILPTTADSISPRGAIPALAAPLLETRFVYEPKSERYLLTTFLDGKPFGTPLPYTFADTSATRASVVKGSTGIASTPLRAVAPSGQASPYAVGSSTASSALAACVSSYRDTPTSRQEGRPFAPTTRPYRRARASRPTSTSRRRSRLVCRLRLGRSSRRG